jgi:urease accessory protein
MRSAVLKKGAAELHVSSVLGRSTVVSSWARNPMCLLTPRARGESVWAYTTSYGGGMVAGDETRLDVKLDSGARCFLGTQASTKIYRNPFRKACSHVLDASIDGNAFLVLAPDPIQCFADSTYQQHQTFHLASEANLVLVDWISAGRSARSERWAFQRYHTRNEIYRNARPIFLDALRLDNETGNLSNRFRTGRFNCLATLVMFGPLLQDHAKESLSIVADAPIKRTANLVVSASPVHEGALLRFTGIDVETVGQAIYSHLHFLKNLLHDDPLSRKW